MMPLFIIIGWSLDKSDELTIDFRSILETLTVFILIIRFHHANPQSTTNNHRTTILTRSTPTRLNPKLATIAGSAIDLISM